MNRIVVLLRMKETVLLLIALATAVLVGGAGALLGAAQPAGAEPLPEEGKILFVRFDIQSGALELQTMNPDGSGRSSFSPSVVGGSPEWSPDGTKFAYVVPASTNEPNAGGIAISSADGTQKTPVPNTVPNSETGPSSTAPQVNDLAWSPDGKKLAFTVDIQAEVCCDENGVPIFRGSSDLYTINVDGSDLTNFRNDVPPEVPFQYPSWSPDGSKIAFASDGFAEIRTVNADGTGQPTGLAEPAFGHHPAWSPDGSKIAFVGHDKDLHVMNADGTEQRNVTTDGGLPPFGTEGTPGVVEENNPEWSPDGTKLVFSGQTVECFGPPPPICFAVGGDVFTIGVDGSNERNLTNNDVNVQVSGNPSWQPVFPDTTAPKVDTVDPDGTKVVARGSTVTANFSEAVQASTLTSETVQLFSGNSKKQVKAALSKTPTSVTLTPSQKLDANTTYKAIVGTGVKDLADNPLDQDQDPSNGNQPKQWTFTTAAR